MGGSVSSGYIDVAESLERVLNTESRLCSLWRCLMILDGREVELNRHLGLVANQAAYGVQFNLVLQVVLLRTGQSESLQSSQMTYCPPSIL